MTCLPKNIIEIFGDTRSFRSRKRQQMDLVLRAFEEFRIGCAFVPGYDEHYDAVTKNLEEWRHKLRQDEWGR